MRVPVAPRTVVPALAAVAGVVAAHTVGYGVAFPGSGARGQHLASTGHSYWPLAAAAALAGAAAALAVSAGRGALRSTAPAHGYAPAADRRDLPWLLACQSVAFVLLEAGERALAGLSPASALQSPGFWLGLVLQLPVAWLALRALRAVEGAARRWAAAAAGHLPRRR
ncbi:MAG: hypothetical protein AB1673_12045, partial [Actinomycetota bacterium]